MALFSVEKLLSVPLQRTATSQSMHGNFDSRSPMDLSLCKHLDRFLLVLAAQLSLGTS